MGRGLGPGDGLLFGVGFSLGVVVRLVAVSRNDILLVLRCNALNSEATRPEHLLP